MTTKEFEEIKNKIISATKKRDMAEGAKQKIEEQWLKDFKLSSSEEVEERIKELEGQIEEDKSKRNQLYSKLEKVCDWDSL